MPHNFTIYWKLLSTAPNNRMQLKKLFNYWQNHSVTILNNIGQSVGNLNFLNLTLLSLEIKKIKRSSETIRENSHKYSSRIMEEMGEKIKKVNDHLTKVNKPKNDNELGYYQAGLIEGDGYLNSQYNQQVITYHLKDAPLAYFIKKSVGFGSISKIKDKKALKYAISSKAGIERIINLINGKLKTKNKWNQQNSLCEKLKIEILPQDQSNLTNNRWLTGFVDANGSFKIKILNRKNRKKSEIRLAQQIDQKFITILEVIKKEFGGSIGYRKKQDTYYYSSVNFGVAKKYIDYFQKYHLQSYKYINFLKWRKVYIQVEKRLHITEEGIKKIKKLKSDTLSSL